MMIRYIAVFAIITILMISGIAYANSTVSAYFTINYVTYLNPNGQATNYYVEYLLTLYNNGPYQVPLNVSMRVPQYSSILYVSPSTATISDNVVTWTVTLQPYSEETLEVRFQPVYTVLPIASLNYEVLVNGTTINSTVINGGIGTSIRLRTNVTNLIPFPVMTTISLTRQSGLFYEYNVTPTISQNILGYEVDYWLFSTSNSTSMVLTMVVENMGPWHSVRVNPINVQVSIDLNQSIDSLTSAIHELNTTINQLRALSGSIVNASYTANNYTGQFLQLIGLLNQTANILGASAYLINSTLLVESLLQAQLIELKMALMAEGQVLNAESTVISQLRGSISPIVSNEQSYLSTLNALKEDLIQIENSTNNSTLTAEINNTINTINQIENALTTLSQVYSNLGTVQSELSSTQAQVNQATQGLNYAISAANESETLIISISRNLYSLHNELLNLTNQLLYTYLGMASYQAKAYSYLAQVSGYEGELEGMIMEDEVKRAVLSELANQYLSLLSINSSNVSIDVTIEETFIINMPSIVNTQYLLQLLNTTGTVPSNKSTTHGIIGITINNYLLLTLGITVLAALVILLLVMKRVH
ncbi:MAG: hypothetical protein ACP5GY_03785 [Vulcanisaeta sp.]